MFVNTAFALSQFYVAMDSMQQSEFEFHLTGSRFFGFAKSSSDHDFFVQESDEVKSFLRSLGFQLNLDAQYIGDPTFVEVFELITEEGVIQVQLIKQSEYSRKQLIQRLLKSQYPKGIPGDKSQKRELWHLTYGILKQLAIA